MTADRNGSSAIQPIAVIGMACRFPGAADYRRYWANSVSRTVSVSEVPISRWDWRDCDRHATGLMPVDVFRWGGFVPDIDRFDAAFFGISRREAELMDPQHRVFLETVWSALEDAGYTSSALAGGRVGCFAGMSSSDYLVSVAQENAFEAHAATGPVDAAHSQG